MNRLAQTQLKRHCQTWGTALSVAWLALSISALRAEDHMRVVILQVPTSEAEAVRAELNDPIKSKIEQTMTQVLKRSGVAQIADDQKRIPWDHVPIKWMHEMGSLKTAAGSTRDLEIDMAFDGMAFDHQLDQFLTTKMTLSPGGKKYLELQHQANSKFPESRWNQWACWGDAKDCVMLWHYTTAKGQHDQLGEPTENGRDSVHVEIRWFKAVEDDIAKLELSKPETRKQALQWLAGRAQLWRECGFQLQKDAGRSHWEVAEGDLSKYDIEKEHFPQEGLSIVAQLFGTGDQLEMQCELEIRKNLETKSEAKSITTPVTPGVWEFKAVKGIAKANVMAYRVTRN